MVAGYVTGEPVLHGFTCTLDVPGLYRLDAPNGAGKSTLLEALSGYLAPFSGEIRLSALPADSPRARERRRICRTAPALFPHMNAADHLIFASRLANAPESAALARASAIGLGPWLNSRADTLSTGSARKLWYLMCTLGDFDFVALDEPFNGLDEEAVAVMTQELARWSRDRVVLLVCHAVPEGLLIDATVHL